MAQTFKKLTINGGGVNDTFINPQIAPDFSTSTAYAIGKYVTYQGQTYRFTAAKTAGAWDATKVTAVNLAGDTDTTLSIAGMAANAKAVGDAVGDLNSAVTSYGEQRDLSYLSFANQGKYVKSDDTIASSGLMSHTGYIEIPAGATSIICGNLTSTPDETTYHLTPNLLFYDENKTKIISLSSSDDVATYAIPSSAKYVRVNQPSKTAPVKESLIKFVVPEYSGFVGAYTVTFTSTATAKGTTIYLEAGKTYLIECNTEMESGHVNAYAYANSSVYAAFYGKGARYLTPTRSGYLYLFNVGGVVTGPVSISVFSQDGYLAKLREVPDIYEVGPTRGHKSLTALLLALKDDDSEKIIYIDGGDYDIFQEYTDLGLLSGDAPSNPGLDYFDYNVWIPDNTHIIGRGLVRLIWEPTASQITTGWSKTISPVNAAGTASLTNVEIHVKNGRYCIHDDPLGKAQYSGAIKAYHNVKCYKETNDEGYGFAAVIGFGLDTRMTYDFDGCLFKHESSGAAFYMHDRTTDPNSENSGATVTVKNCIMDTSGQGVSLGNGASAASGNHHIRVEFENCHIGGTFNIGDEANKTQGTNPNHFDVTVLRCGDVNVQIASTVNPYPAKIYD